MEVTFGNIFQYFSIQLQLALPNNLDKYNLEDAARKAEVEEVDLDNLMETNDGFHNLTNLGVPKTRGMYFTPITVQCTFIQILSIFAENI